MMQPFALLPTKGAVRAGQDRWSNARSFEAFEGYAEAWWRSHVPQRARLDPESHCVTLDALDPCARKSAPWPRPSPAAAPSDGSSSPVRSLLTFSALFRERTFFTSLLWKVVHERDLNERTGRGWR